MSLGAALIALVVVSAPPFDLVVLAAAFFSFPRATVTLCRAHGPAGVAVFFGALGWWVALAAVLLVTLSVEPAHGAEEPPGAHLVLPLTTPDGCVLDRATVDGVPPTTFQVVETRLCGTEARRCWRRYSFTGGKVVELGGVCEATQPRDLAPRWVP
mgnify:CR=1 FL=1